MTHTVATPAPYINTPASERILGYQIFAHDSVQCVREIADTILRTRRKRWLACINPHTYATALGRTDFSAALKNADWLVPDGVGMVLASRALGGHVSDRVTGSDVFLGLHDELQSRGGASVFFLGSTEETLARIRKKMQKDWPGLKVAGTYSPPFRTSFSESEMDDMIAAVNDARPDVLWVGMTAPKQEEWIAKVIDRVDVRFAGAIGAVFDFYIGNVKRAHPVTQKLGLEWLSRLVQDPRRLWRRTFLSAPLFVWHVFRARIGLNRRRVFLERDIADY
jgi:N-acetylglucosaminyldiphosphoundecaprenol N-acetyl-beta-D-mannosaminyltransferase